MEGDPSFHKHISRTHTKPLFLCKSFKKELQPGPKGFEFIAWQRRVGQRYVAKRNDITYQGHTRECRS